MISKNTGNALVGLQFVPGNTFPIKANFLMANVMRIYSIYEVIFANIENVSLKPSRYRGLSPTNPKYSQYH